MTSASTAFVEIERKYRANKVDWDEFVSELHKFAPVKRSRIKGPDTYYEHDDKVLRWRYSSDKSEFTTKQRHSERNTFVRDEVDLKIEDNSPKTIIKFVKALGYKKAFRIYKDCEIFWFHTKAGKVSVVIYDVLCKNRDTQRFIEIEAEKGQDYRLSKNLVRLWEKKLKLKVSQRVSSSLYEMYSGKKMPGTKGVVLCGSCGSLKDPDNFYKRKSGFPKNGDSCKTCTSDRGKSLERKASKKLWRERTTAARSSYMKLYRAANKDRLSKYALARQSRLWKTDVLFKITHSLRNRLNNAIKTARTAKKKNTESYLGCSYAQLLSYVESKFYKNPQTGQEMTWDSWGNGPGTWQLDHIVPFVKTDLSDPEQLNAVNHYSNLRPLWHEEHLTKSIEERKLRVKKV